MALSLQRCSGLRVTQHSRPFASRSVVVRASAAKKDENEQSVVSKLAMPVAATVAASLLLAGQMFAPPDAIAARSGGRAGASSFSARRSQSYAP